MYCPDGVIDEEYTIDLMYCKGCGICANECPKQAIAMVREASDE
jgi:pyruvate ferredoxin oxidoreductase delta subunit